MHLSNGGTNLPNLGLNTPGVMAGLRYAIDEPVITKNKPAGKYIKKNNYIVYTTVALKQAPWIGGNHYFINNFQAEFTRRVSHNYSFGAGVLISYNRSLDYFPL
jgi:hypothetical protein